MLTFPPDISFVVQIVSFLVLWFGLKRLLFDPAMHVLEERERRTGGERHVADGLRKTAEQAAAAYEARMQDIRVKLAGEAEAARNAVVAEERKILADVRTQAAAQLVQLRDSLGRQASAARPAFASEAQTLAAQMFERVIGRKIS